MRYFKSILPVCLLCMSHIICPCQTKNIEKLKAALVRASDEQTKLSIFFSLCGQLRSMHVDTLTYYALAAKKIAVLNKDGYAYAKANYFFGVACVKKGMLDTAFILAGDNLKWLQKNNLDKSLQIEFIFLKANAFMRGNQYKEAVAEYFEALRLAENINDTLLQVKAKSGIGWANMELNHNNEALEWLLKSLHTTSNEQLLNKFPTLYSNISSTCNNLNMFDSAFYFIKKAIDVSEQNEDLLTLANALNIEADIYINTREKNLAEADLNNALAIRKQIGDPYYVVSDIGQLANFLAENGDAQKGIQLAKEGIAIAEKNNLEAKLPYLYTAMGFNYKAVGDYKNYSLTQEKIIALKDAVYQKNNADALAGLQGKYELQKKENTIIQQKLAIVTKNYWLNGLLLSAAFLIVFAYFIFKNYRRKQTIKMGIAVAEEKMLAKLSIKEAEENERRRIATDLHDNLGVYAASIAANLDTISAEEHFNPTSINALTELNSNSQSIISQLGDTIWALKRTALSLTAVSDRLKLVIQKIQPSYLNINIDVVEKLEADPQLHPSQAFHLFQVIQEALINALRHSSCNYVVVLFTGGNDWKVFIEDDGNGIKNKGEVKTGGNGLPNMLNRSKEAGFSITWLHNEKGGTTVAISSTTN